MISGDVPVTLLWHALRGEVQTKLESLPNDRTAAALLCPLPRRFYFLCAVPFCLLFTKIPFGSWLSTVPVSHPHAP